jgi:hypothetical protein
MSEVRFESSNLSSASLNSVEARSVNFIETVCPDGEIFGRLGGNCFKAGEAGEPTK